MNFQMRRTFEVGIQFLSFEEVLRNRGWEFERAQQFSHTINGFTTIIIPLLSSPSPLEMPVNDKQSSKSVMTAFDFSSLAKDKYVVPKCIHYSHQGGGTYYEQIAPHGHCKVLNLVEPQYFLVSKIPKFLIWIFLSIFA